MIWTGYSLRMRGNGSVGLKSPSVWFSRLRSSSLMHNPSPLDSKARLMLPVTVQSVSVQRADCGLLGLCPRAALFHCCLWTFGKPVSTESTGKTPFTSSGSRVEPLQTQREAESVVCSPWEQTCSVASSGRQKSFGFQGCISEQEVNTPVTT